MRQLVSDYGWRQVLTCLSLVTLTMVVMSALFVLAFMAGAS
jgi:hypothetical protein